MAPGAVLNASGYVTARRRATVSSKVTGKVLEVFVEEGKAVHAGQVLARLDDAQVRAALAVAEAQLESARRGAAEDEARLHEAELTLGRREQLVQQQVISKAELDSAQADVESRKARIALAREQIKVSESLVVAAPDRPRRHGGACAVRWRRDFEGRATGRNDFAGIRGRRIHPVGDRHDRGHEVARNRGRRQRELHQPRASESAG